MHVIRRFDYKFFLGGEKFPRDDLEFAFLPHLVALNWMHSWERIIERIDTISSIFSWEFVIVVNASRGFRRRSRLQFTTCSLRYQLDQEMLNYSFIGRPL